MDRVLTASFRKHGKRSNMNKIGQKLKDSEQSQMFGKPCFKVNGKAFICFFKNCMVFKLTDKIHQEALSLDGSDFKKPT